MPTRSALTIERSKETRLLRNNSQQKRLYDWESSAKFESLLPEDRITFEECEQLAAQAFALYGLTSPAIKKGRSNAYWLCYKNTMALPTWAMTRATVLHEAAHGIMERFYKSSEWHSPDFVRVYIELLSHFTNVPVSVIRASAREHGLKIGSIQRPKVSHVKKLKSLTMHRDEISKQLRDHRAAYERAIAPLQKSLSDCDREIRTINESLKEKK